MMVSKSGISWLPGGPSFQVRTVSFREDKWLVTCCSPLILTSLGILGLLYPPNNKQHCFFSKFKEVSCRWVFAMPESIFCDHFLGPLNKFSSPKLFKRKKKSEPFQIRRSQIILTPTRPTLIFGTWNYHSQVCSSNTTPNVLGHSPICDPGNQSMSLWE